MVTPEDGIFSTASLPPFSPDPFFPLPTPENLHIWHKATISSVFNLPFCFPNFLTPTVVRSSPLSQQPTESRVAVCPANGNLFVTIGCVLCLCACTSNLPLSHRESCCSVLIGWWCPSVRKIAKSRPMKSAAVPEYSSPSVLSQKETKHILIN